VEPNNFDRRDLHCGTCCIRSHLLHIAALIGGVIGGVYSVEPNNFDRRDLHCGACCILSHLLHIAALVGGLYSVEPAESFLRCCLHYLVLVAV
jgi:hypothetical protein